jgi:hypothetical protein
MTGVILSTVDGPSLPYSRTGSFVTLCFPGDTICFCILLIDFLVDVQPDSLGACLQNYTGVLSANSLLKKYRNRTSNTIELTKAS